MTKSDWQANYCMSPQKVAARAKLRAVAMAAAVHTSKEFREVLEVLVWAQARDRLADEPGAVPEAVALEIGLHDSDQVRELTRRALEILEGP